MFILGLVGMAVAAWGMTSVDKHFLVQVSTEVDTVQAFPVKLITKVQQLSGELGNVTIPLDNFQGIVEGLNITGMQADLAHIEDFFLNAPTPALLKAVLHDLQTALSTTLTNALSQLADQLNATDSSTPLGKLRHNMAVLTAFSTQPPAMASSIHGYSTNISNLNAE